MGNCWIVAEAGINHLGNRDRMLMFCDEAQRAGADAVKFQAYDTDALLKRRGHGNVTLLKQCQLSDADLDAISAHCKAAGFKWFASVFDLSQIDRVLSRGACALKIGHAESGWGELIKACEDVAPTWISNSKFIPKRRNVFCIEEYPATSNPRLGVLGGYGYLGFSSHYADWRVPALAGARDIDYLEVHLKLDDADPEAAWSLSVSDFTRMVKQVREYQSWL